MAESGTWRLDDAAAAYYEDQFVPAIFRAWAPVLLDAAGAAPGQRILDVACGTGVVARAAAERLGERSDVTGIDLNASMIGVARRLRPDLDWREGDAARMPFRDGTFDAVLSQAALMFFPDRVAALREMRRVLRPGGRIAVQVWGESPGYARLGEIIERVSGRDKAEIFMAPFSLSDPAAVRSLFAEAGFPRAEVRTHQAPARFGSVEALVRTEIEGWVLRGLVDAEAVLAAAREGMRPFVTRSGTVEIPMDGHIVTSVRT